MISLPFLQNFLHIFYFLLDLQMLLFCMDGFMLGSGGHFQLLLRPREFSENVLGTWDLTFFSWRPKNLATVLGDYKLQTAIPA